MHFPPGVKLFSSKEAQAKSTELYNEEVKNLSLH